LLTNKCCSRGVDAPVAAVNTDGHGKKSCHAFAWRLFVPEGVVENNGPTQEPMSVRMQISPCVPLQAIDRRSVLPSRKRSSSSARRKVRRIRHAQKQEGSSSIQPVKKRSSFKRVTCRSNTENGALEEFSELLRWENNKKMVS
jgi:hypothetical protein